MRDLVPGFPQNYKVYRRPCDSEPESKVLLRLPFGSENTNHVSLLLGQLGSCASPDVLCMGHGL